MMVQEMFQLHLLDPTRTPTPTSTSTQTPTPPPSPTRTPTPGAGGSGGDAGRTGSAEEAVVSGLTRLSLILMATVSLVTNLAPLPGHVV
jgi:hypothetical protein